MWGQLGALGKIQNERSLSKKSGIEKKGNEENIICRSQLRLFKGSKKEGDEGQLILMWPGGCGGWGGGGCAGLWRRLGWRGCGVGVGVWGGGGVCTPFWVRGLHLICSPAGVPPGWGLTGGSFAGFFRQVCRAGFPGVYMFSGLKKGGGGGKSPLQCLGRAGGGVGGGWGIVIRINRGGAHLVHPNHPELRKPRAGRGGGVEGSSPNRGWGETSAF